MPAKSQSQQKLFATALAVKRGDRPKSSVDDKVLDIVDNMSEDDIVDFAKTSPKGLPKRVKKEESMTKLRAIIREHIRRLTEADEITLGELPTDKQKLVAQYANVFNGKVEDVWSGIHGYIVHLKVNPQPDRFRFDSDTLKKLINLKIRWIEGDKNVVAIGF